MAPRGWDYVDVVLSPGTPTSIELAVAICTGAGGGRVQVAILSQPDWRTVEP
jgi:hypothetical protein